MGDDPRKEIRLGKVGIEVRRVHVTGDEREQLDVLLRQGSRHARRVADPDLVKRPVLDERVVGHSLISPGHIGRRSEEHTSELQSLMRISYAVFCLKKKKMTSNKRISIKTY